MHHFRKSKPSGDTPAPTPKPPAKLVQKFTSRKDSKAIAATSSAIATSVGSALNTARDASSDGDTVPAMDELGKTAYAAVRMAVDITKESSDMCLPLKAVVGAISALMKNYDVRALCSRTERLLILFLIPDSANDR